MSWKKLRAAVMFGTACLTSPCCTPLIVPLLVGLLAGTPAAVWIMHNVGLIYGLLTLISVVSLILAFRWMNKRQPSQPTVIQPSNQTEA